VSVTGIATTRPLISVRTALQAYQAAFDTAELEHLYEDAKNTLTSALMRIEIRLETLDRSVRALWSTSEHRPRATNSTTPIHYWSS
jgi:hypothetical protein